VALPDHVIRVLNVTISAEKHDFVWYCQAEVLRHSTDICQ